MAFKVYYNNEMEGLNMKELRKNSEEQLEYIKNLLKVIKFFDLSGPGFETFKEEWMKMEKESFVESLTDQLNKEIKEFTDRRKKELGLDD